jgi:ABC-2 type transport system permease protein
MTELEALQPTPEPDEESASGPVPPASLFASEPGPGTHKVVRVVAGRFSMHHRLRELWRRRELFFFLVRKEIKVKYKNSVLGILWSMLNPALNTAVFFVLFTYLLPNGIPNFVIYLFSGQVVWNYFMTAVLGSTGAVVNNAGLVKKVSFPREILSLSAVGSAFVFFLFQAVVVIGLLLALGHRPDWAGIWLLIPALVAVTLFASALAVFLSAVNVYLRDTQHLTEVVLNAWFWAVPCVYSFAKQVAAKFHTHWIGFTYIYFANPLTPVVMTFQRVFYADISPVVITHPKGANGVVTTVRTTQHVLMNYDTHWYVAANLVVAAVSIVLLYGSLIVFGRLEGNFAEEL